MLNSFHLLNFSIFLVNSLGSNLKLSTKNVLKQQHPYHLVANSAWLAALNSVALIKFLAELPSIWIAGLFMLVGLILVRITQYFWSLYQTNLLGAFMLNRVRSIFYTWFNPFRAFGLASVWILLSWFYPHLLRVAFDWVIIVIMLSYSLLGILILFQMEPTEFRFKLLVGLQYLTVCLIAFYNYFSLDAFFAWIASLITINYMLPGSSPVKLDPSVPKKSIDPLLTRLFRGFTPKQPHVGTKIAAEYWKDEAPNSLKASVSARQDSPAMATIASAGVAYTTLSGAAKLSNPLANSTLGPFANANRTLQNGGQVVLTQQKTTTSGPRFWPTTQVTESTITINHPDQLKDQIGRLGVETLLKSTRSSKAALVIIASLEVVKVAAASKIAFELNGVLDYAHESSTKSVPKDPVERISN